MINILRARKKEGERERETEKVDNNNPLGSIIGNALIAHESVKARLAALCWQETKVRSNKAIIVLKSLRALPRKF